MLARCINSTMTVLEEAILAALIATKGSIDELAINAELRQRLASSIKLLSNTPHEIKQEIAFQTLLEILAKESNAAIDQ